MKQASSSQLSDRWSRIERMVFRILFIYFIIQAVPLDPKYFRNLFNIDWSNLHYRDLFYIARYTPQFFPSAANNSWGISSLKDWSVVFIIALVCAAIWTVYDKRRKEYNHLYYLLRVVLRYRLAIGIMAYGFIKIFPTQIPYPSLSLSNTNYGDLSDWKIAYLAYGIAPSFEVFLGSFEILAGLLLLHRKSASIGATIALGFVGNVFLSNLGYNGGEAIYSLYLLLMATVLVSYDALRWHKIIMLGKASAPNRYKPVFVGAWRKGRLILKFAFVAFLLLGYSYYSFALYREGGYQYPKAAGLPNAEGLYNVSEFTINGKTLPYSLTDSIRWQNVVFEKWPTISVRSYKPIEPDTLNTEEIFASDVQRNFESTGSNGRQFYHYEFDSTKQVLYLQNRNRHYANEKLVLEYVRPDENRIVLYGVNEKRDSIYVVLNKLKKNYLLDESYKIPQKRSVFD